MHDQPISGGCRRGWVVGVVVGVVVGATLQL
jgi:hypothetical protein